MNADLFGDEQQTILIVDDSELIHRLLEVHLRTEGHGLTHIVDPFEAVEATREQKPDLILLDIDMPGLCGDQICSALKSNPETHDIPIIFLTGKADIATKVRCFDLGAVDYIEKPFAAPELRARVRAALRTKRYLDLLSTRANIDGLTGLWNRARFDSCANAMVESKRRYGRDSALVLFDIDHFKRCNDRYGHPFGDKVIVSVADRMTESIRVGDTACRYGGEEFAVLLEDARLEKGVAFAERLRADINAMRLRFGDETVGVTASFGVASTEEAVVKDVESFVASADSRLYLAKRGGRNQVRAAA